MHIKIRRETDQDISAIRTVQIEAFKTHPHSNQTEHMIVDRMRHLGDLVISLVAEVNENVVGHIAFSALTIDGLPSNVHLLGPLAVLPEFQRLGIGSELVKHGLDCLKSLNSDSCALFGDPTYYNRFNFYQSTSLHHEGIPQNLLLEFGFSNKHTSGEIRFHDAFYSIA